jgi:hypothetical protein
MIDMEARSGHVTSLDAHFVVAHADNSAPVRAASPRAVTIPIASFSSSASASNSAHQPLKAARAFGDDFRRTCLSEFKTTMHPLCQVIVPTQNGSRILMIGSSRG